MRYTQQVQDHFANPRNVGKIDNADGEATVGSPECGDYIKMWISVEDGVISDIKYKVFGCGAAIATTSAVSELAIGSSLEEANRLTDNDVISCLGGLPPQKQHCSLLGIQGVHQAIRDYKIKENHHYYKASIQKYRQQGVDFPTLCKALADQLTELTDRSNDAVIGDIGTGKGHLASAIAKTGRPCVSLDISAKEQQYASLNAAYFGVEHLITFELENVLDSNIEDDYFDVIVSFLTVHHIRDTETFLQEAIRMLKPGGCMLLADYNEDGFRRAQRVHELENRVHDVKGWSIIKSADWLEQHGLDVRCVPHDCIYILQVMRKE